MFQVWAYFIGEEPELQAVFKTRNEAARHIMLEEIHDHSFDHYYIQEF